MVLSRVIFGLRRKAIPVTDERVKLMSEIVTAIKLVKMYAWEKSFAKKINGKIFVCFCQNNDQCHSLTSLLDIIDGECQWHYFECNLTLSFWEDQVKGIHVAEWNIRFGDLWSQRCLFHSRSQLSFLYWIWKAIQSRTQIPVAWN